MNDAKHHDKETNAICIIESITKYSISYKSSPIRTEQIIISITNILSITSLKLSMDPIALKYIINARKYPMANRKRFVTLKNINENSTGSMIKGAENTNRNHLTINNNTPKNAK